MITVLADQHLYKIKEIISDEIDLQLFDPESGLPENIEQADALLIRTVTKINKQTLSPLPEKLKFVGTGSAGTDHVDVELLKKHDVKFAYAAGCNARSVAEYIGTVLLIWAEEKGIDLQKESIGIVGVGHVGSAVTNLLDQIGWKYVLYDPPRAEREPSFQSSELKDVLNCSILSFHTPLKHTGMYSTWHWLNEKKFTDHTFKLVINTARGGVVDENALLKAIESEKVHDIIVDVWENEPMFNDEIAKKAFIGTPHIAGYSIQSKFRATKMIVEALYDYFRIDQSPIFLSENSLQIRLIDPNISPADFLKLIHPLTEYQNELKKLIGLNKKEKSRKFNLLRTSVPFRHEYVNFNIHESILIKHKVFKSLFIKEKNTK